MNWRDHIEVKPGVMGGKPVIRDTRITVEILLDWLAAGWTEQELFENYPRLTPEALKAVFALSRELMAQQHYDLIERAA